MLVSLSHIVQNVLIYNSNISYGPVANENHALWLVVIGSHVPVDITLCCNRTKFCHTG